MQKALLNVFYGRSIVLDVNLNISTDTCWVLDGTDKSGLVNVNWLQICSFCKFIESCLLTCVCFKREGIQGVICSMGGETGRRSNMWHGEGGERGRKHYLYCQGDTLQFWAEWPSKLYFVRSTVSHLRL